MTKILLAPDSFKESLTSFEVAQHIKTGIEKVSKEFEIDVAPISDGGEGFLMAMISGMNGTFKKFEVHDALLRPVEAPVGFSNDGKTAIIEMAQICGLEMLQPSERNPEITSTYGVGELILHATKQNCKKIILGIGGSSTNDAGAGMAQALGIKLLDKNGQSIKPRGEHLKDIHHIDFSEMATELPEIVVACDVKNPLTGPNGASMVYGPQKGATPEMAHELDNNLKHLAAIVRKEFNFELEVSGAGAAGGLGAGLLFFTKAKLMIGFQLIAETLQLEKKFKRPIGLLQVKEK